MLIQTAKTILEKIVFNNKKEDNEGGKQKEQPEKGYEDGK